jgi:hypothetical protein
MAETLLAKFLNQPSQLPQPGRQLDYSVKSADQVHGLSKREAGRALVPPQSSTSLQLMKQGSENAPIDDLGLALLFDSECQRDFSTADPRLPHITPERSLGAHKGGLITTPVSGRWWMW